MNDQEQSSTGFDIDDLERALSRFEMDTVELLGEAIDLPEREEE